jgi:hypothetical protein
VSAPNPPSSPRADRRQTTKYARGGNAEPGRHADVEARSWLARAHLQLGDAAAALAVTAVERELTYPPEEPAMHLLEGLALLELNRPGDSARAFSEALAALDPD